VRKLKRGEYGVNTKPQRADKQPIPASPKVPALDAAAQRLAATDTPPTPQIPPRGLAMTIKDIYGHALSGADANSTQRYEAACALLRCYVGDPLARRRPRWRRRRT
jgi:hypothetical protein